MKFAKILMHLLLAGLAIGLGSGCASQKTWSYHANTYSAPAAVLDKKIAVMPYEDGRVNENNNLWGLAFLPVMPFGLQELNTPEGVSAHTTSGLWVNYKPTEDFAKALAEDLRSTHMFSDAFFDYRRESGDYAIQGKIDNTHYDGKLITYGLSCYGVYMWFVGFPSCWTENELSVELSLLEAKSQKVLFSKSYTANPRSNLSWLYYVNSDFHYSEMLAEINKQFCADIQPIIQGIKPTP